MKGIVNNKKAIMVFTLPALILYTVIVFVPIVWSLIYSFYEGIPGLGIDFVGLNNYFKLFKDPNFIKSVVLNLKYVAVVVTGQITIGMLISFLYAFSLTNYATLIRTIIFFPVVLPTVATSQLFAKIFQITPHLGLLNEFFHKISMENLVVGWLGDPKLAFWAICIMDIWKAIGLYALLFYGAIINIPKDVLEAAEIDGARGYKLITKIVLPLIKPMTITCLVLSLTGTLKVFDSVVALTNGGPGNTTQMTSMYMYNTTFVNGEFGYGTTMAIFILFECLVAMFVLNRFSKDK